jgi:hypothetical protein
MFSSILNIVLNVHETTCMLDKEFDQCVCVSF